MQGRGKTSSLGYCIGIGPKFTRLKQNHQQVTHHRFFFYHYFVYLRLESIKKKRCYCFLWKNVLVNSPNCKEINKTRTPRIIIELKRKSPQSTTASFERCITYQTSR